MLRRKPPRRVCAGLVLLGFWAVLVGPTAGIAQTSPEESAGKLRPAEGLEATLWASEPMVVNPTSMDLDSRGRIWIAEGLNYRPTDNRKLPTIEEADRIKILEDTDGDGKADKMTVFADHIFPVPMGLAVEEHYGQDGRYLGSRVFVGNSPNLLVLEDTDGDDKADRRSTLLTGFGGVDSDHGLHGMLLGLDGKLYFTHGDGCCTIEGGKNVGTRNFDVTDPSGRHVWTDRQANVLRCNRDGTQFEVVCDGQRNNYEVCMTAFGEGFVSDNDDDGQRGCRVIWVMDGGDYGRHTSRRLHWGEELPGNVPKLVGTGNGSPSGILTYEGHLLPGLFRGGLLEADAGTRQINFFPLTRHGASFRTEPDLLLGSDDPWFRPVDVTTAPDGSVFIADWYDSGVGGHAFSDQTTGRIYRVDPKGATAGRTPIDFATLPGLIAALKSPVIAAQDVARRLLIERGREQKQEVVVALVNLFSSGEAPERARALWVLHAVVGDQAAIDALQDREPRIREQAVRMLGRDDRENGRVAYLSPEAQHPPLALAHLPSLLPMADDPDPGVRRELILALRNLPTEKVGEALKKLARSWDGQDRWYLEALGLALEDREATFLAELFDGSFYGDLDLDLDRAGQERQVALPPYFPADRNEAFIAAGTPDLPASALSKTLGLAWRIHRTEALPLLARIAPRLQSPELQQAADDALSQIKDPETALVLVDLARKAEDPARTRQILTTLGRKLDRDWRGARESPQVVEEIESALRDSELRLQGIMLAAATGDARYGRELEALVRDARMPEEVRAAAVEALGRIKPPQVADFLEGLIAEARGKPSSSALAEAAIRALPRVEDPRQRLVDLILTGDYPLGLRREALRTFATLPQGGTRLLSLARSGQLPVDLKTEATTVLNAHPEKEVRREAAEVLPLPNTASGRPLPPVPELLRRNGHADLGRDVFFRTGANSCAGCHRVQGLGQWIGPDLSTIGTKYGKDELLRSILNPSAAVGYNYRALVVALMDGRILTGLPVEDGADRIVLKTAEGQLVTILPDEVEDRKSSDVSLMPEGLAQTMSVQDLVNLLAFLSNLRQPVSIVGQYQVIGPVGESNGAPALDPTRKVDLSASLRGPEGRKLSWRRVSANSEGLIDLTTVADPEPSRAVYLHVPVHSPIPQEARLVLDTKAEIKVWLGGKPLDRPSPGDDLHQAQVVSLPSGTTDLLIRVPGGSHSGLVTTFISNRPLEFSVGESQVSAR